MQFTIDIPDRLAEPLRAAVGPDLGRAALEQLALQGYQAGHLSAFQVQQLLGFADRYSTRDWLAGRGAHEAYSLDDLDADRRTLTRLLPS
jgi:hypothetical protein